MLSLACCVLGIYSLVSLWWFKCVLYGVIQTVGLSAVNLLIWCRLCKAEEGKWKCFIKFVWPFAISLFVDCVFWTSSNNCFSYLFPTVRTPETSWKPSMLFCDVNVAATELSPSRQICRMLHTNQTLEGHQIASNSVRFLSHYFFWFEWDIQTNTISKHKRRTSFSSFPNVSEAKSCNWKHSIKHL